MKITKFTRVLEKLAAKTKPLFWLSSKYYCSVIQKEIRLADIKKDDHILCIGGGNCPFSAILFHKRTGAKITVIDNEPNCQKTSQKLIKSMGLNENICVKCKDGGCPFFDLSKFTVVHFALQVSPVEEVFSNILKRVSPGTKLLVRRPKNTLEKMYCCLDKSKFGECKCVKHTKSCNIGCTLLYVKKGEAE
ncbi:MAG: hypothetical protein FWE23_02130 [Chitinivibrionia bacterium]|jgi:protein-L-isoaspartate O-methyltransferase|nr:hypothetical protein [Chitinivibrionia bacterium]